MYHLRTLLDGDNLSDTVALRNAARKTLKKPEATLEDLRWEYLMQLALRIVRIENRKMRRKHKFFIEVLPGGSLGLLIFNN